MQNLKVLHIVAGSNHGGAETFCLDAIEALDDAGVKQFVMCRAHDRYIEVLEQRKIPYEIMKFSHLEKILRAPKRIRSRVKSFEPSLIHAWMGRAASFVPSGLNIPVLGWFGGYYDLKRYKNCNFYMGVTRDIVRHIIEKTGKPDRAFVVHTFGTLKPEPSVERSTFSTPEDASLVLLLSRMHWKKGVDVLLQAAKQLPDTYFWLAGDGPDLEKYKQQCTALGLDDRVRFLGWRDDRAALLEAADICVLPSRYEPFGTVIAESWFAGVPLVAAKAAGALQYVEHGKNGMLCEIDDIDGLAKQIKSIENDITLRADLIANGKITYNELFSRETTTRDLLKSYNTMIDTMPIKKCA